MRIESFIGRSTSGPGLFGHDLVEAVTEAARQASSNRQIEKALATVLDTTTRSSYAAAMARLAQLGVGYNPHMGKLIAHIYCRRTV